MRGAVLRGVLLLAALLPLLASADVPPPGPAAPKPRAPVARRDAPPAPAPSATCAQEGVHTQRAWSRQCLTPKPLSACDVQAGRIAWKYFERNFHPDTGLVNSVDGYPSTAMWDLGSSLFGFLGARELGIISQKEFDDKVVGLLGALGRQNLFNGELPNKAYSAANGGMTNYANQPSEGIGYSAIDLGRLMSALSVLAGLHPKHRDNVEQVLRRWNFCRVVRDGQLIGVHVGPEGKAYEGQEGRFGYEQYAGKAFQQLGFPAATAASYTGPNVGQTMIEGVPIRFDLRDPKRTGAYNYVLTESYALDAMEFGLDAQNRELVRNIYEAQKRRWQRTGQVTAVSEDHIPGPPYFIYNTLFVSGQPWLAITDQGQEFEQFKSVSTKAAFSLAALFPEDPYSEVLLAKVESAYDPERGWYSGVFERGGYNTAMTSNTNGIVLETLLYKLYGPLHPLCASCNRALRLPHEPLKAGPESSQCLPGQPPPPNGPKPLPTRPPPPKADGAPGAGKAPASQGKEGAGTPAGKPSAGKDVASGPGPPAPETEAAGESQVSLIPTAIPTGNVVVGPPILPRTEKGPGLRLSGNFSAAYGLDGVPTVGGIASWSPARYFFVRGGASVAPLAASHRFRYLWGLGYDDWHDGTLTVQLHNWGPIFPQEGFDFGDAQAHVGYKIPKLCQGPVCASPYAYVEVPLSVGPSVGMRLTLTVRERWFLMGGTSYAIPGLTDVTRLDGQHRFAFSYGVGWRAWQAGLPFLTLYNWGPNPALKRSVLSLGINWAI